MSLALRDVLVRSVLPGAGVVGNQQIVLKGEQEVRHGLVSRLASPPLSCLITERTFFTAFIRYGIILLTYCLLVYGLSSLEM